MAKSGKGEFFDFGLIIEMALKGGAKTAKQMEDANKAIERSINRAENAVGEYKAKLHALHDEFTAGRITRERYEQQIISLKYREDKRLARIEKERRAVMGLDKQESTLERNRRNRARMAGMAASGVSGLGMGGRAAGAARFLGGAAGLGLGAAGIGVGFFGLAAAKESISAFAKLQQKVEGMKSLFGEDIAVRLSDQFRELSKTTILTNSQLIENARTWASYGLTTEGLTDRLKRLGTVAGGNSERFRALTIAFAQVNAQGKLMGQEKNQLINAGFGLKAVADAAGISMTEFADSMKDGEITAEHLNQALINVTSEGGLFADYLERQADTINGKLTILSATWEEFLIKLGTSEEVAAGVAIDALTQLLKELKGLTEWWMGERDLISDKTFPERTLQQTTSRLPVMGGMSGGLMPSPYARSGKEYEELRAAMEEERKRREQQEEAAAVSKEVADQLAKNFELQMAVVRASEGFQGHLMSDVETRMERTGTQDIGQRERFLIHEQARQIEEVYGKEARATFEEIYPSVFDDEFVENFVGPMRATAVEAENLRKHEMDLQRKQMDTLHKIAVDAATDKAQAEMDIMKEQFDARQKEVTENLSRERRIAQGPSQRDAMFTGGSVEEFMFLRKQTQQNETAKAVKEAEEKARQQRAEIEAERKAAQAEFKSFLEDLVTNQLPQQLDQPGK